MNIMKLNIFSSLFPNFGIVSKDIVSRERTNQLEKSFGSPEKKIKIGKH
jgi:hypothetical protein